MDSTNAISRLTDQPALDAIATPLSGAIRGAYESAGIAGQQAKNAMHGVWLGHPLHPVFTDVHSVRGRRDSCLTSSRR